MRAEGALGNYNTQNMVEKAEEKKNEEITKRKITVQKIYEYIKAHLNEKYKPFNLSNIVINASAISSVKFHSLLFTFLLN